MAMNTNDPNRRLDGVAALLVANRTSLKKLKGEKDTAFVKRIVCEYLQAEAEINAEIEASKFSGPG